MCKTWHLRRRIFCQLNIFVTGSKQIALLHITPHVQNPAAAGFSTCSPANAASVGWVSRAKRGVTHRFDGKRFWIIF
jgi:hypothetical protein